MEAKFYDEILKDDAKFCFKTQKRVINYFNKLQYFKILQILKFWYLKIIRFLFN